MHIARLSVPSRAALRWAMVVVALLAGAQPAAAQRVFALSSRDVSGQAPAGLAQVFAGGSCQGGNRSPQLSWQNPPPGTQGYAVTIFDPDAPGPGWWHWEAAVIPANVTSLPANASGSGYLRQLGAAEARNDFGQDGYGGPCPPPGQLHHYVVTVYALKSPDLRVATGRPAPMFDHEIHSRAIGSAQLIFTYQR